MANELPRAAIVSSTNEIPSHMGFIFILVSNAALVPRKVMLPLKIGGEVVNAMSVEFIMFEYRLFSLKGIIQFKLIKLIISYAFRVWLGICKIAREFLGKKMSDPSSLYPVVLILYFSRALAKFDNTAREQMPFLVGAVVGLQLSASY